jgi:hypothetical protein
MTEPKIVNVHYQDPDKSSEMGVALSDTEIEVRSVPASVEPVGHHQDRRAAA